MEHKQLTLGSLFDGSGGFPLGGLLNGIMPLWASEVEPFPIRVTTKRMPWVRHYGDVSVLNGTELPPVDIITFGSPCQDLSIAGKRAGLEGERSSLFYQAIRIVKEMRCKTNGRYPRFVVWENVQGAFSSNKGEDFRCVLEAISQVKDTAAAVPKPQNSKWIGAGSIVGNGYSVAWRLFDAQYWGVPQRRKRIYLVADFAGECAGKILFEQESMPWYSAPRSFPWQGTAGGTADCLGAAGSLCLNDQGGQRMDVTEHVTSTLRASSNHPPLVFENHSQDTRYNGPLDVAQTVLSTYGTGGNNQPLVVENSNQGDVAVVYGICSKDSNAMKSANPKSGFYEAETSRCLDANGGNPSCNQGGMAVVEVQGSMVGRIEHSIADEESCFTRNTADRHAVAFAEASFHEYTEGDTSGTLRASGGAYGGGSETLVYSTSKTSYHTLAEENIASTLVASDYKDPPTVNELKQASGKEVFGTLSASMGSKQGIGKQETSSGDYPSMKPEYIVRRLTPTECARLQGFPDWWCADLETEHPSAEDIQFWQEVFKTHRKVIGKASKDKTEKQIIKWLQHPHADSAEYKMWGNGVALPNVYFVLHGIVHYGVNLMADEVKHP